MLPVRTAEDCRFSVLTACLPVRSQHLGAAAASIAQVRRDIAPLTLEWVVAIDGPGTLPIDVNPDVTVRLSKRGGISTARNAALSHARGDLVVPLDADDALVSEGLLEAHEALGNPGLGWIGANRVLLESDERTAHWHGARMWHPGSFAEAWTAPLAFHPNSFVAVRELVLRCGGWPALLANEDLMLVMMMSEQESGASIASILTRYRVWDSQEVSSETYPATKKESFLFIEQAINAVRQQRGRLPVTHPVPGGAHGIARLEESR